MPDSSPNLSIQWNRPLLTRLGSRFRLAGIRIFYDFGWSEIFSDERTQFRNGRRLALLVQQDCPAPKTAALLLTDQSDQPERTIETDQYYVFVVRVRDYLASATADPAATYCARRMQTPLTRLQDLQTLGTQPALLQSIIDRYIDLSAIIRWLGTNRDRAEQLRAIVETAHGGAPDEGTGATRRALEALAALDSLDPEVLDLLTSRLQRQALSPTSRDALMRAISAGADGLIAASAILGQRIADRVAAARAAADAFGVLLENPNSNETDLQSFIEDHPWLIGLEYVNVTPKRSAPQRPTRFSTTAI